MHDHNLRNLSPLAMFLEMARSNRPRHAYVEGDFAAWKARALPEVLATLGEFPAAVPPRPEMVAEWSHAGLRTQKWYLDVGPHISAAFLINFPANIASGAKLPGILCCHGHGAYGKEPVMGNDSGPELRAAIAGANYDYGRQMAQAGFVTFAIDWLGFGERRDGHKPNNFYRGSELRDWCANLYLHATMLGMTTLGINVMHGRAAIDFALSFSEIDPERLGVMGLSFGGTMSLWMTLCDARIKATEIICYSDLWEAFGIRDNNYCGSQVAPGLYRLVDLPDLQGLIAPRPLLVDLGANDTCFRIESSMPCFEKVRRIYQAAAAAEHLHLDLHPGGHAWGGNFSKNFFKHYLGG
ncbi:MAG: alpha/beta hydrolase family protein [Kiritimatiellia bacterium]|nr:hypothetical protein [Lentisphaerota bacterium]